ncbi:hypothetical protein [Bernardetia sp.]|uniref:hypothetical protein n=1 Tax=Bernardetia sp. TaxID=1937974 RepID=UPI0025C1BDA5|nr:hypothetical protein [Bernardetia sp.]
MGITIIIFLGILEGFARILVDEDKLAYQRLGGTAFKKTIPPPLQNSDYDVKWFAQNYDSLEIERIKHPSKENAVYLEAPQNPYLTIENNRRRTTNTPNIDNFSSQSKLYIFGGSTVFCREVPDSLTLPSYLQRFILDTYPSMRVVNCGIAGVSTPTQLANLELMIDSVKEKDIVIFYDGVNNSIKGISTIEEALAQKSSQNNFLSSILVFLYRLRERLYILLHQKSMLINWLLYPYGPVEPALTSNNLTERKEFNYYLDSIATSYIEDIARANAICKKKKATFFHFLQPQLASRKPHTNFEKDTLISNPYQRTAYDLAYFETCYPAFRDKLDSLKTKQDILSYDISHTFDNYEKDVYIDICHLSQHGNLKVAQTIVNHITKK